ncbi:MAG: dTMP kinase [Spirochaetae bacterium HGW-Spirochaetae-5]|nr:MAG: dTMP kinase [Spirochaetae bacterium HGW-Spirochaetae-5]
MKNKFIVFEGIDGSGKSTQCSLLYSYIASKDIPVKLLAEPTSGIYGQQIRKMLQSETPVSVDEQIRLFIEDRQQDFDLNIKPCMEHGQTIVMDRYFYSNAAYQGSSIISPEDIIGKNIERGFPLPDRVYYIDIEPAEAMRRITARSASGKTELFEKKTFLEGVRKNFLHMADNRFLKIDGSASQDEIFNIIKNDYLVLIG